MVTEPIFYLHSLSLLSKWGFGDGDALDDWWWDNFNEDPPFNDHDMLHTLVVAHLLPALRERGWDVTVTRIETNHNPVRASIINGEDVEHYWYADLKHPLGDIPVGVTRAEIEALLLRDVSPPPPAPSS